jgi:hypothetical protein
MVNPEEFLKLSPTGIIPTPIDLNVLPNDFRKDALDLFYQNQSQGGVIFTEEE